MGGFEKFNGFTVPLVKNNDDGTHSQHLLAGGITRRVFASFSRPADAVAYAAGDLIANSTTAGSVTVMQFSAARIAGGSGAVMRARLRKSTATLTNAAFRLHLYRAVPTPTNGDNGVWLTSGAMSYIGAIDITVDRAFTDGAAGNGVPIVGSAINFDLSSKSDALLYGLLEARAAYVPGSGETFEVDLEIYQD